MGNICSRSANKPDDAFSQPGRVLGSSATPAQGPTRASVPGKVVLQGPGRTLGGENLPTDEPGDAKNKAAEAAQRRAEALNASSKGKLGSQLAAQKAQTHAKTLNAASDAERAARDADNAEDARRWD